jgi:hypothetical protein
LNEGCRPLIFDCHKKLIKKRIIFLTEIWSVWEGEEETKRKCCVCTESGIRGSRHPKYYKERVCEWVNEWEGYQQKVYIKKMIGMRTTNNIHDHLLKVFYCLCQHPIEWAM